MILLSGAGVVDQDVHVAHTLQGLVSQAVDVGLLRSVGGDPAGVDAGGLQVGHGLFQVSRLARAEHDARTRLAQRMGHLQAQAARAAGDERGLALEIEELLNGAGHAGVSWVKVQNASSGAAAQVMSRLSTTRSQASIFGSS